MLLLGERSQSEKLLWAVFPNNTSDIKYVGFSYLNQFSNSADTNPTIQFSSDPNYLELVQDCSHFRSQMKSQVATVFLTYQW